MEEAREEEEHKANDDCYNKTEGRKKPQRTKGTAKHQGEKVAMLGAACS